METTMSIFSYKTKRLLYAIINILLLIVTIVPTALFFRGTLFIEGEILSIQVILPWILGITNISKINAFICILKFAIGIIYAVSLVMCCIDIFIIIKNFVRIMKNGKESDLDVRKLVDLNYFFAKQIVFNLAIFIIGLSFVYEIIIFPVRIWIYISILLLPLIKLIKDCSDETDFKLFPDRIMLFIETTICIFITLMMLDTMSTPLVQTFLSDIGEFFRLYNIGQLFYKINRHFITPGVTIFFVLKCKTVLSEATNSMKICSSIRGNIEDHFRSMLIISLIFFAVSGVSNAFLISNFTDVYKDTLSILKYFFDIGADLYLSVALFSGAGLLAVSFGVKYDSLYKLIPKKYREKLESEEDEKEEDGGDKSDEAQDAEKSEAPEHDNADVVMASESTAAIE